MPFSETYEKEKEALAFLEETLSRFKRVAVANSFGKDSMVVHHLVRRIEPKIRAFMIMTPYKPPETAVFRNRVAIEWKLTNLAVVESDEPAPDNLYLTDPQECCRLNKVEPLRKALLEMELDAWVSGLRRTESDERSHHSRLEVLDGVNKVNPILDWTELDIWKYTATHELPVNPLYRQGYRSLGCSPCSRPGGELERSGRWFGSPLEGGECGIHTMEFLNAD